MFAHALLKLCFRDFSQYIWEIFRKFLNLNIRTYSGNFSRLHLLGYDQLIILPSSAPTGKFNLNWDEFSIILNFSSLTEKVVVNLNQTLDTSNIDLNSISVISLVWSVSTTKSLLIPDFCYKCTETTEQLTFTAQLVQA